jgi:hypothetical protein
VQLEQQEAVRPLNRKEPQPKNEPALQRKEARARIGFCDCFLQQLKSCFTNSISRHGGTAGWLWNFRLDDVGRWHDSELLSLGG